MKDNFEVRHRSNAASVSDTEAVARILSEYEHAITYQYAFDPEEGTIQFWGDTDTFDVHDADGDGELTIQFLDELRPYITDALVIQTVAFEGTGVPHVYRLVVTEERVEKQSFESIEGAVERDVYRE